MPRSVPFPPETITTPDGTTHTVTGTQGGGAYVTYEDNDGHEIPIDWLTLSDPETDWDFAPKSSD